MAYLSPDTKDRIIISLARLEAGREVIAALEANGGGGITEEQVQLMINTAIAGVINGAPEALDTLNELAAALADDENFAATMATALGNKENKITAGTILQYWRGDKTWQTLDKNAIGLDQVNNTSDADKPISDATQTALDGKEDAITAGTTSEYWRGDKSWQTLDKSAVGLDQVDNTSDADKPISDATQTALDDLQTAIDDLKALNNEQQIYVDSTAGDDTTGTGSELAPLKTIQNAVTLITNPALSYVIFLAAGEYNGVPVTIPANASVVGNSSSIICDVTLGVDAGSEVFPIYSGVNLNNLSMDLSAASVALPVFFNAGFSISRVDATTGPHFFQIHDGNLNSLSLVGNASLSNVLFTGSCDVQSGGSLVTSGCIMGSNVDIYGTGSIVMNGCTFPGTITGHIVGADTPTVRTDSSSLALGGTITDCNVIYNDNASSVNFNMGNSADWSPSVANVAEALDQLAARPSASSIAWGDITGDLIDQTDLQNALDNKVAKDGDTMSGSLTIDLSISGSVQTTDLDGANMYIHFTDDATSLDVNTSLEPGGIGYHYQDSTVNNYMAMSGPDGQLSLYNIQSSTLYPTLPTSGEHVTTKAYVDSKVEDSITDGVTDKAPSQNAVFDALSGKFDNPAGTAADYVAGDGSIIAFPSVAASDRLVTTVYNSTGASVPAGSVIYLNGPHGNLPELILAQADSEAHSFLTYGITQSTIGDQSSGIAVQEGRLENLNTNISGWNEGDILFLSPTVAGGLTNVKPTAPNHMVIVGTLVRKHPAQGVVQVKIQNGYELDELHNVAINGTLANNDTLLYDSVTQLWKNSPAGSVVNKLTKGTKTIFCIDNGDFATGQAAIDAASANDIILFGTKAGGWGDLVIPAGKTLSLKGLQAGRSPNMVQVGSITFSPTTGANILQNELYIDSLYIYSTTADCITHGGTAPSRIRISKCYINCAGAATRAVVFSNTHATSSSYLYDNIIGSSAAATVIQSSIAYARAYRNSVDGSNVGITLTAGTFENNLTNYSMNFAGNVANITGGTFLCGYSLISNTGANSSGVAVSTGAVFASSYNSFSVPTGTGYCVRGTGVHVYGSMTFANSVLAAYNVKVQNTLTNVAYTTAFTLTP